MKRYDQTLETKERTNFENDLRNEKKNKKTKLEIKNELKSKSNVDWKETFI
jgi:hypothetical protein